MANETITKEQELAILREQREYQDKMDNFADSMAKDVGDSESSELNLDTEMSDLIEGYEPLDSIERPYTEEEIEDNIVFQNNIDMERDIISNLATEESARKIEENLVSNIEDSVNSKVSTKSNSIILPHNRSQEEMVVLTKRLDDARLQDKINLEMSKRVENQIQKTLIENQKFKKEGIGAESLDKLINDVKIKAPTSEFQNPGKFDFENKELHRKIAMVGIYSKEIGKDILATKGVLKINEEFLSQDPLQVNYEKASLELREKFYPQDKKDERSGIVTSGGSKINGYIQDIPELTKNMDKLLDVSISNEEKFEALTKVNTIFEETKERLDIKALRMGNATREMNNSMSENGMEPKGDSFRLKGIELEMYSIKGNDNNGSPIYSKDPINLLDGIENLSEEEIKKKIKKAFRDDIDGFIGKENKLIKGIENLYGKEAQSRGKTLSDLGPTDMIVPWKVGLAVAEAGAVWLKIFGSIGKIAINKYKENEVLKEVLEFKKSMNLSSEIKGLDEDLNSIDLTGISKELMEENNQKIRDFIEKFPGENFEDKLDAAKKEERQTLYQKNGLNDEGKDLDSENPRSKEDLEKLNLDIENQIESKFRIYKPDEIDRFSKDHQELLKSRLNLTEKDLVLISKSDDDFTRVALLLSDTETRDKVSQAEKDIINKSKESSKDIQKLIKDNPSYLEGSHSKSLISQALVVAEQNPLLEGIKSENLKFIEANGSMIEEIKEKKEELNKSIKSSEEKLDSIEKDSPEFTEESGLLNTKKSLFLKLEKMEEDLPKRIQESKAKVVNIDNVLSSNNKILDSTIKAIQQRESLLGVELTTFDTPPTAKNILESSEKIGERDLNQEILDLRNNKDGSSSSFASSYDKVGVGLSKELKELDQAFIESGNNPEALKKTKELSSTLINKMEKNINDLEISSSSPISPAFIIKESLKESPLESPSKNMLINSIEKGLKDPSLTSKDIINGILFSPPTDFSPMKDIFRNFIECGNKIKELALVGVSPEALANMDSNNEHIVNFKKSFSKLTTHLEAQGSSLNTMINGMEGVFAPDKLDGLLGAMAGPGVYATMQSIMKDEDPSNLSKEAKLKVQKVLDDAGIKGMSPERAGGKAIGEDPQEVAVIAKLQKDDQNLEDLRKKDDIRREKAAIARDKKDKIDEEEMEEKKKDDKDNSSMDMSGN